MAGVVTLIRNLEIQVAGVEEVVCERLLYLTLKVKETVVEFFNVYVPAEREAHSEFFKKLAVNMLGWRLRIITGDINYILEEGDWKGSMENAGIESTLKHLKPDFKSRPFNGSVERGEGFMRIDLGEEPIKNWFSFYMSKGVEVFD